MGGVIGGRGGTEEPVDTSRRRLCQKERVVCHSNSGEGRGGEVEGGIKRNEGSRYSNRRDPDGVLQESPGTLVSKFKSVLVDTPLVP